MRASAKSFLRRHVSCLILGLFFCFHSAVAQVEELISPELLDSLKVAYVGLQKIKLPSKDQSWAYECKKTTYHNGEIDREELVSFDPRRIGSQKSQLVTLNGSAPTDLERNSYTEKLRLEDRSSGMHYSPELTDLSIVKNTSEELVIGANLNSMKVDSNFELEDLYMLVAFDMKKSIVQHVELSTQKSAWNGIIRVSEIKGTQEFELSEDGTESLLKKTQLHLSASVLRLYSIKMDVVEECSNYRRIENSESSLQS